MPNLQLKQQSHLVMRNKFFLLLLMVCFLLFGCSTSLKRNDDYRHQQGLGYFKPIDIEPVLQQQNYQQKFSHLIILKDSSLSMFRKYKGYTKQDYLEIISDRIMRTIPAAMALRKTIISFGGINQKSFSEILIDVATLVRELSERPTILVLSDWSLINNFSQGSVDELIHEFGNELCINMIGIGNIHQNNTLTDWSNCGQQVSADSIYTPVRMADFVRKLLFSEPADSDGDGIYDYMDKCPETNKNEVINWSGCQRDSSKSHPYYRVLGNLNKKL
jgi:hypothetical protein